MSGYARAWPLVAEAAGDLRPRVRQTVAEHAASHRHLRNEGGGYVGRWSHDIAPYLVEPMEALTSLDYLTVAIVGPGQSGKTEIAHNWLHKSVHTDPGDFLWYMQTDAGIEAHVKGKIDPMIDLHPELRDQLGRRPVDNSIHFKRFRGMKVEFLSATLSNLINKSAPRIVADEIDAYAEGMGDVKALLDVRRQTFGRRSKLLAISHPDLARGLNPDSDWTAGVMAIYADSARCCWYWPCPHCGAWSSPVPIARRVMSITYPVDGTLDEVEHEARLVCPVNGCLIEDGQRRGMNLRGRWIGEGQQISESGEVTGDRVKRKTAGYWIVGAMSPFVLGGIGGLARARVKAEREQEISGDDNTLRQVVVKQFGMPYSGRRATGSVDANTLADRADPTLALGSVPDGVRFLAAVADCQLSHFDWMVRGWGVGGQSWIIDRGRLPADPATSAEDWDELLATVFLRQYPLADGSGRVMRVRGAGYDSQGQPGVTQQAYAAFNRWRRRKDLIRYGQIGGWEVFSVMPLRGRSTLDAPRLQVVYPATKKKANKAASAGTVPVLQFNPNQFKDDLQGQLMKAEAGDWFVNFPRALRSKEPPHAWFEQLTAEQRLASGRWEKRSQNARNEATDLMVMSHVVAQLHGMHQIDWTRPPRWAAEWDRNALVMTLGQGDDEEAPVAAPTAAAPPVQAQPAPARRRGSLIDRLA